jgi:hypothetical protein
MAARELPTRMWLSEFSPDGPFARPDSLVSDVRNGRLGEAQIAQGEPEELAHAQTEEYKCKRRLVTVAPDGSKDGGLVGFVVTTTRPAASGALRSAVAGAELNVDQRGEGGLC